MKKLIQSYSLGILSLLLLLTLTGCMFLISEAYDAVESSRESKRQAAEQAAEKEKESKRQAAEKATESKRQAECKLEECIIPDMYEFTLGDKYKDKFNVSDVQSKCVIIKGKFLQVVPHQIGLPLGDKWEILLILQNEKATRPIRVYTTIAFRDQFKNLKPQQAITVYGRSVLWGGEFHLLMNGIKPE